MKLSLTTAARSFMDIHDDGSSALTIESFVVAGCCTPDLPPEVKLGLPRFPDGFATYEVDGLTIYYDSLLPEPDQVTVDVKDYGKRQELVISNWAPEAEPLTLEFEQNQ